jgi:hypothetical protein
MHDLVIEHNPLLSACAVKSICDYLSIIPDDSWYSPSIDSNAIGCNSIPEVLEICTFGIDDPVLNQSGIVYPNPSSGVLHLRYSISDIRSSIFELYSIHGVKVRTLLSEVQQPGEYEVTFDIRSLPAGMYLLVMQTGKERRVNKVIKY